MFSRVVKLNVAFQTVSESRKVSTALVPVATYDQIGEPLDSYYFLDNYYCHERDRISRASRA